MNFNVKCFKSILNEQNIKLESKKLNIFIGQNGVGKTNILESIDWLINPSNKQVTTEKNPYHKGVNTVSISKTEIFMITDLTNAERDQIRIIFEKYNISLSFEKLNKIEYKTPTITGNQYNFDWNKVKSAQKFLINQLLKIIYNNGNSWLMSEFFKTTGDGTFYYDGGLAEIQKLQINDDIKKKHSELTEDIKIILLWTKELRECTYVKNADFENNLEYSYSFDQYKNNNDTNKDGKVTSKYTFCAI